MMNLILATESTYKRQQLKTLMLPFEALPAAGEEDHSMSQDANELAIRLAESKAIQVFERNKTSVVIGSDQTAVDPHGQLLTKPGNFENAFKQLKSCSNGVASFYSAVHVKTPTESNGWSVKTEVYFRDLSDEDIERYLKKDTPYDCAGSFKMESLGISLFTRVVSEDPSALIGLPLISISQELRRLGFSI